MNDTPDAPRIKPCQWTVGYLAAMEEVFGHLKDMSGAAPPFTIYTLHLELADRLGLSDDARDLLHLPHNLQL